MRLQPRSGDARSCYETTIALAIGEHLRSTLHGLFERQLGTCRPAVKRVADGDREPRSTLDVRRRARHDAYDADDSAGSYAIADGSTRRRTRRRRLDSPMRCDRLKRRNRRRARLALGSRRSRQRSGVASLGAGFEASPAYGLRAPPDPLLAALVDLLLPQGHGLLERVDRVLAGGERILAMRG